MAVFKITMVFSYDGYGWTESYLLQTPGTPTPFNVWVGQGLNLASNRGGLLVPAASMDYVRISMVGTRFASQVFPGIGAGTWCAGSNIRGCTADGLPPNVALLMNWEPFVPGPEKHTFLRGLPSDINVNGKYVPTPVWNKASTIWQNTLYGTGLPAGYAWGWWGVTSSTSAQVTGYLQNPTGTVTITASQNLWAGVPLGTKVLLRVSGVNYKSTLNGTNVYYTAGQNSCTTKDQIAVSPFVSPGKVEYPLFGFLQGAFTAGAIQFERLQSRKCGRQLFLEHGRAPIRVRH